jgi:hypothetical protein
MDIDKVDECLRYGYLLHYIEARGSPKNVRISVCLWYLVDVISGATANPSPLQVQFSQNPIAACQGQFPKWAMDNATYTSYSNYFYQIAANSLRLSNGVQKVDMIVSRQGNRNAALQKLRVILSVRLDSTW